MKLKPIFDNIVVKKITSEEKTKSGIVLPDTIDKEKPQQGEVVAIGDGKVLENGERTKMEVSVGDKVLFRKYAPDEIKIEGVEYLVMTQSDVIAIIN